MCQALQKLAIERRKVSMTNSKVSKIELKRAKIIKTPTHLHYDVLVQESLHKLFCATLNMSVAELFLFLLAGTIPSLLGEAV